MPTADEFASGVRAATGPELREAQRRFGLLMSKVSASAIRADALHLARSADLSPQGSESFAGIVDLQIDDCGDVAALAHLANFPALTTLRLGGLQGIGDLAWLPPMPRLRALRLEGCGDSLKSLRGIAAVPSLQALVIEPRGARAVVDSLEPLAVLADLRLLALPAIAATNPSLRALATLLKLELFHGTAYYGPEEYAALATALPKLRCPWFSDAAWQLL